MHTVLGTGQVCSNLEGLFFRRVSKVHFHGGFWETRHAWPSRILMLASTCTVSDFLKKKMAHPLLPLSLPLSVENITCRPRLFVVCERVDVFPTKCGGTGETDFPSRCFLGKQKRVQGTVYSVQCRKKLSQKHRVLVSWKTNSKKLRFRFKIPIIIVLMRLTCSRLKH